MSPNLNLFDPDSYNSEASEATGWVAPENFETEFVLGNGFIWYFFDNDDSQSVPVNGLNLSLTGIAPSEDITVPIASGNWNLVGNPFASNIDASQLSGAGLQSAAGQIWGSNDDSFVVVEFTAGSTITNW